MYQDGGTVRTSANDRFAFETGVERRCVKRVSKSTQKGERANIGVCVTKKSLFSVNDTKKPLKKCTAPGIQLGDIRGDCIENSPATVLREWCVGFA